MYIYFEPQGGFNDILSNINNTILYCEKYKRILLVNGLKSFYNINFNDYFDIDNNYIIFDSEKINEICNNSTYRIYPNYFEGKMQDILNKKINFTFKNDNIFFYNDIRLDLPNADVKEEIIIYSRCGGGNGHLLYKELKFKIDIKKICHERYKLLKKPYLCIQVRNTDRKCDYISFYENHKNEICSYEEIYIATDDKKVIDFYLQKGLPIKNFATFPQLENYLSLHSANIDPKIKMIDLLSELFIAGMSDKIMSNSYGGFINLIRTINKNKNLLFDQFL